MAARRSTFETSARWVAGSWTLSLVLAVTGFWPWWAFHSKALLVVWLAFLGVVFAMLKARAGGRARH